MHMYMDECPNTQDIRNVHPDVDFTLPAMMNDLNTRQMLPLMYDLFSNFV